MEAEQPEKVARYFDLSLGCWVYSCGCNQFQDCWDYCKYHKTLGGYQAVLADLHDTNEGKI